MKKNILFISRNFYQYDNIIKDEFRRNGYTVYSYNILPNLSLLDKISLQIRGEEVVKRKAQLQQEYILNELSELSIKIDVVFLLAGQTMRPETLETLHEMYPDAKFVWYIWDNTQKLKDFALNKKYFDIIVSFDKKEAEEQNFICLPLFYVREKRNQKEYDLCFVGADHSNRKDIIEQILRQCLDKRVWIYLLSSRVNKLKAFTRGIYINTYQYLQLEPLDYEQTINMISKSKCVLDIPDPAQTGLTMRTLEAVGTHSKLITTNKTIKNYDFYNENNIYILDIDNIKLPSKDFFDSPYTELNDIVFSKYSVSTWAKKIISIFEADEV